MKPIGYYFGKYAPQWFVEKLLYWRFGIVPFKPCVIQYDDSPRIEMVLRDTFMVWEEWGSEGVQIAKDNDGRIVAIQVPGLLT